MKKIKNYIDGSVSALSENYLDIDDPSKGEKIGEVTLSSKEDFNRVIASSQKAFLNWSEITPLKRSRIISKYKEILEKNIEELAKTISEEHGKTLDDAKGSVIRGLEVVEFACGIPHLLKGDFSQNVGTGIDSWSVRQPLGITAGITPFNFPAMVPMWMYPISIACGNSFILKPSEKDPSCAIKLAELFSEAGLPDGVFNVINGDKDVVNMILEEKLISSISFVGSTPVAKYIYEKSASNGKRVQALGGAKNHLVVMPDANLNQAVDGIMGAAYGSAGERCMAVSVAVAVGGIADKLVEQISNRAQTLKVAPWTDSASDMGPVISKEHKKKILNYIDIGEKEGATLVLDGRNIKIQGYEKYDLFEYASKMRNTILKWTGIPTSIGIASTKSLSKISNKIARKYPNKTKHVHILDTDSKRVKALNYFALNDIWGIGRRLSKRLQNIGCKNALDFVNLPEQWVKSNLSIVELRIQQELKGVSNLDLDSLKIKKSIATTRSFEEPLSDLIKLKERVSTFSLSCAEKLRRQNSTCNVMIVFIRSNYFRKDLRQHSCSKVIALPFATNSSLVLNSYALKAVEDIFKSGINYKKAGVIVTNLVPNNSYQLGIFQNEDCRHKSLMKTMDYINSKYSEKVKLANQDLKRRWKMKQEFLSPCYTTKIEDVIQIK